MHRQRRAFIEFKGISEKVLNACTSCFDVKLAGAYNLLRSFAPPANEPHKATYIDT